MTRLPTLDRHRDRVETAKRLFPRACVAAGLPEPAREHHFHPTRKWRFDYAWPARRVALEVEGGAFSGGRHTRGAGFRRDLEKYNAAALHGWTLLRVLPEQLLTAGTFDMLRRALARAGRP